LALCRFLLADVNDDADFSVTKGKGNSNELRAIARDHIEIGGLKHDMKKGF
jgi:hypothetical protein